jgi:hypothetical protein
MLVQIRSVMTGGELPHFWHYFDSESMPNCVPLVIVLRVLTSQNDEIFFTNFDLISNRALCVQYLQQHVLIVFTCKFTTFLL